MLVLLIGVAGGLGVLSRYGISSALEPGASPWTVVAINVAGSFALGLLAGAGAPGDVRAVAGVGFLGGFTTFSTFSLDVFADLEAGRMGRAFAVVGVSVVVGVAAAAAGWALGRS